MGGEWLAVREARIRKLNGEGQGGESKKRGLRWGERGRGLGGVLPTAPKCGRREPRAIRAFVPLIASADPIHALAIAKASPEAFDVASGAGIALAVSKRNFTAHELIEGV